MGETVTSGPQIIGYFKEVYNYNDFMEFGTWSLN